MSLYYLFCVFQIRIEEENQICVFDNVSNFILD